MTNGDDFAYIYRGNNSYYTLTNGDYISHEKEKRSQNPIKFQQCQH